MTYDLRADRIAHETIPFSANADADVRTLRWFVDSEYLGETLRDDVFWWHGRPGNFVVRVVDDNGRSQSVFLSVALVQ